ncbi:defense protein l(2)34Fc-like [Lytechinus variegatus]|uniref:defense protein l(2)34Fc-like n=1 Tax=Lytechinus variegatus TaxID=7654 RepID=UPI001BB1C9B6|nr:defense protein l(2)34Fc-like [Lytechinus variegatus]
MIATKRCVPAGILVALLFSCLLENTVVHSRSTGAPVDEYNQICETMTPGHYASGQTSESPYSIMLQNDYYTPGVDMTVEISGSANLKGLLLQMRNAVTEGIVGSWSVSDADNFQTVSCNGNNNKAVTHKNANPKTLPVSFTWTPPDVGGQNVYAVATFVQDFQTYWIKVTSSVISDSMATGEGGSMTTSNGDSMTTSNGDSMTTSTGDSMTTSTGDSMTNSTGDSMTNSTEDSMTTEEGNSMTTMPPGDSMTTEGEGSILSYSSILTISALGLVLVISKLIIA